MPATRDIAIVRHEYVSRKGKHHVKGQAYLVDEGARARVGARVGRVPERAAQVDVAEVIGVHVRVRARVGARAVVRERRVVVRVDVRVVALHRAVPRARVRPEPRRVARRRRRVRLQVRQRPRCVGLRRGCGGVQRGLLR